MVGKTKPATKAEKARFVRIKACRCLACAYEGVRQVQPTEAHHLLSGGKRRGHSQSIPLCGWHHRGEPITGHTTKFMPLIYGPSLRLESKAFHERYGSDDELLAKVNELISEAA